MGAEERKLTNALHQQATIKDSSHFCLNKIGEEVVIDPIVAESIIN